MSSQLEELGLEKEMTPRNHRAVRFGFLFLVASQVVPYVVLYEAKYVYAGGYVSPRASQILGIVTVALMIISLAFAWGVKGIVHGSGDQEAIRSRLKMAGLSGILAIITTFYQWSGRYTAPQSRFGEMFFIITGADIVYAVVGLIILWAAISRAGRISLKPEKYWIADAARYFWTFVTLTWIGSWIVVYLL
jgi:cytochrome c oxidase subunit 3